MRVRADHAAGLGVGGCALAISVANGSDHPIVLVLEGEFFVRYDIVRYLQDAGCLVLEASTADQAVAICRAGTPVDVLFTDINLNGGGNGWEVAEAFRAARPSIAVMYTSGNCADRSRCVPASKFFSKPYRMSDILNACRSART
jgi:CheY-like chemotaxis protein